MSGRFGWRRRQVASAPLGPLASHDTYGSVLPRVGLWGLIDEAIDCPVLIRRPATAAEQKRNESREKQGQQYVCGLR